MTAGAARSRWFGRLLLLALGGLSGLYIGSYTYLSRRGMAEARQNGWPYFFYVPIAEVGPGSPGLQRHYRLAELYDPLNRVDHACFGGGDPCRGITWGLSR